MMMRGWWVVCDGEVWGVWVVIDGVCVLVS